MSQTGLPATLETAAADFLRDVHAQKGRWRETSTKFDGLTSYFHWTGHGRDAVEVALATSSRKLTTTEARSVWKSRQGHSAAPLLTVIAYADGAEVRTVVCGPSGDSPTVADLDLSQAERLAASALAETNRHLAARMIQGALEQTSDELPGLRNKGLLATHELFNGVPRRHDWAAAESKGRAMLRLRDHDLIRGLGYHLEQTGGHQVLRTSSGTARVIAVFLQEDEQPDYPSFRFGMQTPVSYALTQADRDNVPWVISVRGSSLRLYSAATSGAVGQRGRAETYVELDLSLLPSDKAGYLHLLFSSEALTQDGTFYEIQQASRDFTTGLSARLRERVYEQAIPRLALSIAKQVGGSSETELAQHYRTALTILFRLLFISYAEDSRLLPLHVNGEYTDNSLKALAIHIAEGINAGRDLGFHNPFTGEAPVQPDTAQNDLWRDCQALFRAVDKGHQRWGIPAYNGGLFSPDPSVNPVGGIIKDLDLNNADFGPALAALIIDRTPDGAVGPIDFRSLSVREFGTIYEGLLESDLSVAEQDLALGKDATYLPAKEGDRVVVPAGDVYLHNKSGQRKATGSYFTKPFAVDHLLDHALVPTLDEHLARVAKLVEAEREADAVDALFDFRVADISMGSGHFLTAVVDRIEAQISSFLAEHPIPQVAAELNDLRQHATNALGDNAAGVEIENASLLRRLIARRCVYGVDLNPISVELARVSMWIHTFVPGLPLSFLNHNLVVGDSLTGIATIEEAAAAMSKVDGTQVSMFNDPLREALAAAEAPLQRLARLVDATPKDIEAARETEKIVKAAVEPVTAFFDVTVAVRTKQRAAPVITSPEDLFKLRDDDSRSVANELGSLHFPVAFPEVFLRERPGFDVIVGNPPWEKVKVETHEFWGRHFPGFRALPQREKEAAAKRYAESRPDLAAALAAEQETAKNMAVIMKSGSYELGSGDTELARVFSWRFWHLLRDGGRFGVVIPRQATLAAPGMKAWRDQIMTGGAFDDVALLVNNREWVFESVHPQYTVGLTTVHKGSDDGHVRLSGPFRSMPEYLEGQKREPETIEADEFRTWSDDLIFPMLNDESDVSIYRSLLAHLRIGDERTDWRFRPLRELDATNDKHLYQFDVPNSTGLWPVYSGASFNLWTPETGEIYAWVDPKQVVSHLHEKRARQARTRSSAFYGLPEAEVAQPRTLPAYKPRIAFRDVARATDQRTLIAALVPPHVVHQHTAPTLVRVQATETDEAYLLGFLSSRVLDWYARRQVETHMTFSIFNTLPVPEVAHDHPGRCRVIELAGRLCAIDDRYAEWAKAVGVDYGPVPEDQAEDMKPELDACVARLYGLDEQQIRDLYATFHPTWDHEPWTEAVLEHYRNIAWDPAEVTA